MAKEVSRMEREMEMRKKNGKKQAKAQMMTNSFKKIKNRSKAKIKKDRLVKMTDYR